MKAAMIPTRKLRKVIHKMDILLGGRVTRYFERLVMLSTADIIYL